MAADLSTDGRLDLATANVGSGDVLVLLGSGDGTFRAKQRFAEGLYPGALVAADWNGDARPDLAAANRDSGGVSVLVGNGDGTFLAPRSYEAGGDAQDLVAADLNGDGRADLATANSRSNDVSALFGVGDGTFETAQRFVVGIAPADIVAADFDGNGRLDLATANSGTSDVSVLLYSSIDGIPPVVRCPEALVAQCAGPEGVLVDFTAAAEDDCDPSPRVACNPPPGSTFPTGTTTVTCTATDGSGNTASCTFQVTVTCGHQLPGDSNQDRRLDLSDAVWLLGHLFLGAQPALPCEGGAAEDPGPGDRALLDSNGDGAVDLSDAVWVLSYLFGPGSPPVLGTECVPIPGCPETCRP